MSSFNFYYIQIMIDTMSGHEVKNGEIINVFDENGNSTLSFTSFTFKVLHSDKVVTCHSKMAVMMKKDVDTFVASKLEKFFSVNDTFSTEEEATAVAEAAIASFKLINNI